MLLFYGLLQNLMKFFSYEVSRKGNKTQKLLHYLQFFNITIGMNKLHLAFTLHF